MARIMGHAGSGYVFCMKCSHCCVYFSVLELHQPVTPGNPLSRPHWPASDRVSLGYPSQETKWRWSDHRSHQRRYAISSTHLNDQWQISIYLYWTDLICNGNPVLLFGFNTQVDVWGNYENYNGNDINRSKLFRYYVRLITMICYQRWSSLTTYIRVPWPRWVDDKQWTNTWTWDAVNSFMSRQHGCHVADSIFIRNYMFEYNFFYFSFLTGSVVNNLLLQRMIWDFTGHTPLYKPTKNVTVYRRMHTSSLYTCHFHTHFLERKWC